MQLTRPKRLGWARGRPRLHRPSCGQRGRHSYKRQPPCRQLPCTLPPLPLHNACLSGASPSRRLELGQPASTSKSAAPLVQESLMCARKGVLPVRAATLVPRVSSVSRFLAPRRRGQPVSRSADQHPSCSPACPRPPPVPLHCSRRSSTALVADCVSRTALARVRPATTSASACLPARPTPMTLTHCAVADRRISCAHHQLHFPICHLVLLLPLNAWSAL